MGQTRGELAEARERVFEPQLLFELGDGREIGEQADSKKHVIGNQ